jgi:hypothetical protein
VPDEVHALDARRAARGRDERGAVELEVGAEAPGAPALDAALAVAAQLAEEDARAALEERARQRTEAPAAPVLREAVEQEEGRVAARGARAGKRRLDEREALPVARDGGVRGLPQRRRGGRATGAAARGGRPQSQPWRR